MAFGCALNEASIKGGCARSRQSKNSRQKATEPAARPSRQQAATMRVFLKFVFWLGLSRLLS